MPSTTAYLEHVAFYVRDLAPHRAFFETVLGMTVTQIDGPEDAPRQLWLLGGIQLTEKPDFDGTEGRFNHLGIVCTDLQAAIEGALAHGGVQTAQGPHWVRMPDGLHLEFMAQKHDAVRIVRSIDRRG